MSVPRVAAVGAGAVLLGAILVAAPAAVALPDPVTPAVVTGGLTSDSGSPALTWTQTSPGVTIVEVADLDIAAGETLDIVQSPGDVLVVRITGTTDAVLAGALTADASVYVVRSGAGDLRVDAGGSIETGGRLLLAAGDAADSDLASPDEIDVALVGAGDVVVAGTVLSAADTAFHGAHVELAGSVTVTDAGDVFVLSGDTATLGFTTLYVSAGAGVVGGGITISGSITARSGAVLVSSTSPIVVTGDVLAERGALTFAGTATVSGSGLTTRARGDASPAGQATGAWLTDAGAGSLAITGYSMTLVTLTGNAVHGQAAVSAQSVELQPDGFQMLGVFAVCDAVTGPEPSASVFVAALSSPLVPDVLGGLDADIPNQPALDLGPEGRVYVNRQSTSVVGDYEVLRVTALRFETPTGTYSFGEAACGRLLPAGSGGGAASGGGGGSLPPTGARDPGLVAAVASVALVAGLLLVRRRRILARVVRRRGVKPPIAPSPAV